MHTKKLNYYLVVTIVLLSLVPAATSFILLNDILRSTINYSLNNQIKTLLEGYQNDLKKLNMYDPDNGNHYRSKFNSITEELLVYQNPHEWLQVLKNTYLTYYIALFVCVLMVVVLLAIVIVKKISSSYNRLQFEHARKAERLTELEHFDEWQILASNIAHEIKNPLTPIEIMISNLLRSHTKNNPDEFEKMLYSTHSTIINELDKIKNLVNHFSNFSKLPEPDFTDSCPCYLLSKFTSQYQNAWDGLSLHFSTTVKKSAVLIRIDSVLLTQCLLNLINNAKEANPDKLDLQVNIELTLENPHWLKINLKNNGAPIPKSNLDKIFKMYFTSKKNKLNFGVGLPICKKIILDHGGDISCIDTSVGVIFQILLPISNSKSLAKERD